MHGSFTIMRISQRDGLMHDRMDCHPFSLNTRSLGCILFISKADRIKQIKQKLAAVHSVDF